MSEGQITWEELQRVRLWAAEIYSVASEEMLHLAQAWNILSAVGGAPYYLRPNFPQGRQYYGIEQPIVLEPFGHQALARFIAYEQPMSNLAPRPPALDDEPGTFRSVGELYQQIEDEILTIPEGVLFVGNPKAQVDQSSAHFPSLIRVHDRASAKAAIDLIRHQGEGVPDDRRDSHFALFNRIEAAYVQALRQNPAFAPVRPAASNPVPRERGDWAGTGPVSPIKHPLARDLADLFDDVYTMMLRMLQHTFAAGATGENSKRFSAAAIALMATVIKPLGEELMRLPLAEGSSLRAGPAFGLTRHVPLPADAAVSRLISHERLAELADVAAALAARNPSNAMDVAARRLLSITQSIAAENKGS